MNSVDIFFISLNIVLAVLLSLALVPILVWAERRGAGLIQDRLGPNRCNIAGVILGGIVQAVADVLKLVYKEEFLPKHIQNRFLFLLSPGIVFFSAFMTFLVIPLAGDVQIGDKTYMIQGLPVTIGITWFLAFAALNVYGIILAGWSSHNKYGLLGGIRASAQVISYEAGLGLSLVSMILIYGTVDLRSIVTQQADTYLGILPAWGIFLQPFVFILFTVAAFAETNRAPFDTAEGESEIVGGFHTEYSAMKFALFFMGEYIAMATSSALIITIFFGGYNLPYLSTIDMHNYITEIAIVVMIVIPLSMMVFYRWMQRSNPDRINERKVLTGIIVAIVISTELSLGSLLFFGFDDLSTQVTTMVLQLIVFITKFLIMNFVFVWVRWTLPRFRYDQIQSLGWKILLPLAILNIFVTGLIVVLKDL